MNRKSIIQFLILINFILFFTSCGDSNYGDIIKTTNKYIDMQKEFVTKVSKTENTKEIATIIKDMYREKVKLDSKMEDLVVKYKDDLSTRNNLPEKLIQNLKEINENNQVFFGIINSLVRKYDSSQDIADAFAYGKQLEAKYNNEN